MQRGKRCPRFLVSCLPSSSRQGLGAALPRIAPEPLHLCPFQATISFYQLMHMQTAALPVYFQTLCESSKLYDPGQQYASHVKQLQRGDEPETLYDFEPYVPQSAW